MAWRIELSDEAEAAITKMDRQNQGRFSKFFGRLMARDNPRSLGKALSGPLGTFWSYRVEDYRAICDIHNNVLTVKIIRIGHRREIYRT